MNDSEINVAALEAHLAEVNQAAQACYEQAMRDMCLHFSISGDNANRVLEAGAVTINGMEVVLVSGSMSDPWTLQIISDIETPPSGNSEDFYKALLLANTMMLGSGGSFGLNPSTGHGMMMSYLSMRDAHFNGEYLAEYLNQMTLFYGERKQATPSDAQLVPGAVFG